MTYIENVLKTNSPQWHGRSLDLSELEDSLIDVIRACNRLDKIKKFLFAGKGDFKVGCINSGHIPNLFDPFNEISGTDITHAIIGMATEAGELCELLYSVIQGKKFDVVNFKEELGDSSWYQAVAVNAIGSSFDEIQDINIAKLRTRYSRNFTSEECLNRNLDKERKALESER